LAEHSIQISASDFSLSALDTVTPSSDILIGRRAPVGGLDTIVIGKAGDDGYISYVHVGESNPVQLTAPAQPGEYELRYRFGDHTYVSTRAIRVQ